ncbi:MAG: DNA topoisomerase 3 [Desulfotomaculaceae bacterium]|nr:DNA topoisomerase 3 [Desulfotomaculaceae bacterium]
MKRTLVVAEKPSQAHAYASALGVRGKGQGYLENDQYVITWCVGHLLELARPEEYMDLEKVGKRWSLNRLPVLPGIHAFRRIVKPGTRRQFQIIKKWLQSTNIEQVICGTDADREGQLLFQEVWDLVRCSKPLSRLWISSLTREAILEGMRSLLPGQAVAGLAAAGHGRAFADWDFGMNLTEGFTALFGSFDTARKKPSVISIGRVQTPTLALIVRREWEIEKFVAETYFEVKATFAAGQGGYSGRWFDPGQRNKRLTDRQAAENIAAKTEGQPGKIIKVEQKEISEAPPLLFDLTSLTVAASKRYGFSAEKVLELAQSLYEKKAITYPRTDCAYLPADLIPKLPAHLQAVRREPYLESAGEALELGVPRGKRVINTITAHHAIIPTIEKISPEKLSAAEGNLYDLIVRRFLAVWFPAARYQQTGIVTKAAQELFRTKGKILLSPGWKKVYHFKDLQAPGKKTGKVRHKDGTEDESKDLPPVHRDESVQTREVRIEGKATQPPKRFTQGDLLKAMEGAGKQIEDDVLRQQMKGKGLGTVATRPAIIENLIRRGYVRQEQKALKPTDKGTQLIALIQDRLPQARLLISAEMTGQLEYDLAQVEKGELTLEKYMGEVEEAVIRVLNELRTYEQKHGKTPLALAPAKTVKKAKKPVKSERSHHGQPAKPLQEKTFEKLGACPRCGGEVIEGQKGYGCSNWKNGCGFVLWKTPICGKVLTKTQVKSLLKKGKTSLIKGFKSKNGQTFTAHLVWEDAVGGKLKFEFADPGSNRISKE